MVSDNILYLDFKKTSTKDFFVYTWTKSIAKYVILTDIKHHRQLIIDGMHLFFFKWSLKEEGTLTLTYKLTAGQKKLQTTGTTSKKLFINKMV